MATTGQGLAVSAGINLAVLVVLLIAFNFLRIWSTTKKFFSARRYYSVPNRKKPKRLPQSYVGWFGPLFSYTTMEMMDIAGIDALMWLKIIDFGREIFTFIFIWSWITILPVNLMNSVVEKEQLRQEAFDIKENEEQEQEGDPLSDEDPNERPYFYTDLDKTTLTNVADREVTLWVHLISVYVISFFIYRLLWQYQREAVALRIAYLSKQPRGAESHTIFVTDVPGIQWGTPLHRAYTLAKTTFYRFLPRIVIDRLDAAVEAAGSAFGSAMGAGNQLELSKIKSQADESQVADLKALRETVHERYHRRNGNGKQVSHPAAKGAASRPVQLEEERFVDARDRRESWRSVKSDFEGLSRGGSTAGREGDAKMEEDLMTTTGTSVTDLDPWATAERKLASGKTARQMVFEEFQEVYPTNSVAQVFMVRATGALQGLHKQYEDTLQQLRDTVDGYTASLRRRQAPKKRQEMRIVPLLNGSWAVEKYGQKPVKVDTLKFLSEKATKLFDQVLETQEAAWTETSPSGFVTLKTRFLQTIGSSSLHHHDQSMFRTTFAPNPKEIFWANLGWRAWERNVRFMLAWGIFITMCIFFSIPVLALQTFINKIAEIEWVRNTLNDFPAVDGIVQGILPSLALMIFLAIVPHLCRFINIFQGSYSESQIDFGVVRKYFIFSVIVVFIVQTLGGALLDQLQEFASNPGSIVTILGTSVPRQASFFVNYLLLQGLNGEPIQMFRAGELVMFVILSRLATSERRKARLWKDQVAQYGRDIVPHTTAILLGLVFAQVQPVIALVALLYFLVMTVLWRYQLLYIYTEQYQSGGKLWPIVFDQIMAALALMQLMMLGVLSVKRFPFSSLLVPLPIITLVFYVTAISMFNRPLEVLSLRAAHDLDRLDERQPLTPEQQEEEDMYYLHPAFKVVRAPLEEILEEVEVVERMLHRHHLGEELGELPELVEEDEWIDPDTSEDEDDNDGSLKPATPARSPLPTPSPKTAGLREPRPSHQALLEEGRAQTKAERAELVGVKVVGEDTAGGSQV